MSTISQNITAALDRESCRTFRTLIMVRKLLFSRLTLSVTIVVVWTERH